MKGGEEIVETVWTNRGGPQRPLSFEDLATKFADNAGRVVSPDVVAGVREACAKLETLTDVAELLRGI
jgi:hypothetical protein